MPYNTFIDMHKTLYTYNILLKKNYAACAPTLGPAEHRRAAGRSCTAPCSWTWCPGRPSGPLSCPYGHSSPPPPAPGPRSVTTGRLANVSSSSPCGPVSNSQTPINVFFLCIPTWFMCKMSGQARLPLLA